jgi:hypothetical protein
MKIDIAQEHRIEQVFGTISVDGVRREMGETITCECWNPPYISRCTNLAVYRLIINPNEIAAYRYDTVCADCAKVLLEQYPYHGIEIVESEESEEGNGAQVQTLESYESLTKRTTATPVIPYRIPSIPPKRDPRETVYQTRRPTPHARIDAAVADDSALDDAIDDI